MIWSAWSARPTWPATCPKARSGTSSRRSQADPAQRSRSTTTSAASGRTPIVDSLGDGTAHAHRRDRTPPIKDELTLSPHALEPRRSGEGWALADEVYNQCFRPPTALTGFGSVGAPERSQALTAAAECPCKVNVTH